MLTNQDILQIALRQHAVDSGCAPEDFLSEQNKVVTSRPHPDARRYLSLPFDCDLTSYGNNIDRFPIEHCFETPNLHVLMDALRLHGLNICFMAEYFLPDVTTVHPLDCPYETRLLTRPDFADLYRPEWSNALCEKRQHLDMLAVGAYDNGSLIALAGASADCDTMWQIGIDVLPAYRRRGIASALTSRLACEILHRELVPFYCCAWSNLRSARNALRSGFRPAWVQVTAKPQAMIDDMNRPAP